MNNNQKIRSAVENRILHSCDEQVGKQVSVLGPLSRYIGTVCTTTSFQLSAVIQAINGHIRQGPA